MLSLPYSTYWTDKNQKADDVWWQKKCRDPETLRPGAGVPLGETLAEAARSGQAP